MGVTQTISASEFKAKCLSLLDRLARRELDRVIITKRGKPVAIVEPPQQQTDEVRNIHGFIRGSVIIADDVDLTAPVVDEPLSAENGELHG